MSDADKKTDARTLCNEYRSVLQKVPHSRGDHTDRCRMENGGMPPKDPKDCHCHVGPVNLMLQADRENSDK